MMSVSTYLFFVFKNEKKYLLFCCIVFLFMYFCSVISFYLFHVCKK